MCIDAELLAVHVLADGYVFHFRSNDSLLGIIHLCTAFPCFGPVRQGDMFEAEMIERLVVTPHFTIFGCDRRQLFHITAGSNPGFTHTRQTFLQVNLHGRITEWSAGIIDVNGSIRCHYLFSVYDFNGWCQIYFLHSDPDEREKLSVHISFLPLCVCFLIVIHTYEF